MFSRFSVNASVIASWALIITSLFIGGHELAIVGAACLLMSFIVGVMSHGAESQSWRDEKTKLESFRKAVSASVDQEIGMATQKFMKEVDKVASTEKRASELVALLKGAMKDATGDRAW